MFDLDSAQKKRLNQVWECYQADGIALNDIFLSDTVMELLDYQKIALDTFNAEKILSVIPFCEAVFVHICPYCINTKNFHIFKGLVEGGLITPVLTSSYRDYSQEIVDTVAARPHISMYEYGLYKSIILTNNSEDALCHHCIDERKSALVKLVHRKRNAPAFRAHLDTITRNIYPFIAPDYDILNEVESCFLELDLARCEQIVDTSYGIRSVRNAQALRAPLLLTDEKLEVLYDYGIPELDELQRVGLQLRELISHGLGLKVPTTMPITDYVALVKEIRPHMQSINTKMLQVGETNNGETSLREVFNNITEVNREVDRILRSKRYLFLEAAVSLISNNKALLASSLLSAGLGLSGSLLGCGATASVGVALNQIQKKGKLQSSPSVTNLGKAVRRDLEPTLRKVVAAYVGSTEIPLQVIAVKQKLGAR